MDYVDLYLVHWPVPMYGMYTQAWKALEKIYSDGRAKAIGVSNFMQHHLQAIFDMCQTKPMVNQIPIHPYYVNEELIAFCQKNGIVLTGYSPLGGGRDTEKLLHEPVLAMLAKKYNKLPAQIVIKWSVQMGFVTIPGSTKPERIRQNFDLFDFELTKEDIAQIETINSHTQMMRDMPYDPDKMDVLF